MIKKNDTFQGRCRARKKDGKRCSKRVQWLIPICVGRQSWLDALKTGWPRCVKGMVSPEYRDVGFCRFHGNNYDETEIKFIYGLGKIGPVKLGPEYEEAKKVGDYAVRQAGFDV